MDGVVIGVDPHKRSNAMEVLDAEHSALAAGRLGTDREGYRSMLAAGCRYPSRLWAVEGCNGVGKHLAQRPVTVARLTRPMRAQSRRRRCARPADRDLW